MYCHSASWRAAVTHTPLHKSKLQTETLKWMLLVSLHLIVLVKLWIQLVCEVDCSVCPSRLAWRQDGETSVSVWIKLDKWCGTCLLREDPPGTATPPRLSVTVTGAESVNPASPPNCPLLGAVGHYTIFFSTFSIRRRWLEQGDSSPASCCELLVWLTGSVDLKWISWQRTSAPACS